MSILVRAIISAVAISGLPNPSLAQTLAPVDPCLADPAAPLGDGSRTQKLDDCNGVLVPPKIGDGEIVEPAPQGGTLRVIPPPKVAGPNEDSSAIDTPDSGGADIGYDIAEIVEAVARSTTTARELEALQNPKVEVRDISILLGGSNAAVLNASLMEHAADVEALRQAISKNVALASAVTDKGLSVEGISQRKSTMRNR